MLARAFVSQLLPNPIKWYKEHKNEEGQKKKKLKKTKVNMSKSWANDSFRYTLYIAVEIQLSPSY